MTIKDIAKLAQVSVSTVSKILNHKDDDIGEETRKKVLKIVKQYQYTPYSKVREVAVGRSYLFAVILPENLYYKEEPFLFIQNTDNFMPFSKGDLKRIFYTVVNSGWDNFTFYCPHEYTSCIDDMREFSQDQNLLTHINNYVHPYNSFSNINHFGNYSLYTGSF